MLTLTFMIVNVQLAMAITFEGLFTFRALHILNLYVKLAGTKVLITKNGD